jgi:hypothetical protein
MACPNFKNGPKKGLCPLGVKGTHVTRCKLYDGRIQNINCKY